MLFKIVFTTLFCCVLTSTDFPNILEVRSCVVLVGERNVTFQNSFIQTNYEGEDIYFSACKDLAQVGCNKEALICLKNNGRIINFIYKWKESSENFILKSEENYEFEVKLFLGNEKYKLTKNNDNNNLKKYTLEINPDFKEYCTKTIKDRNLFFKDISKDIEIKSNNLLVSLNLCGTSPINCPNKDFSICSFNTSTNETLNWGQVSRLNVNDDQGDIIFEFKTKSGKGGLHSSVTLKCNWTTVMGRKFFKRSQNRLDVVIESYLGCSKKHRSCIFSDMDNFLYDLSTLSRFNGRNLLDDDKKRNIKLNICGPLKTERSCSAQQSQICLFNDQELNYGSVMTPITIENDIIKFSIKDGSQCPNNSTLNLRSNFKLHCSFEEEGPKLIQENECSLEILWKTPAACPKLDQNEKPSKNFQEKRPCVVKDGDKTYDLTPLSLNANNYVVKNDKVDFLVNVCKPVVQNNDTFCQNRMGMCLRNNLEPNIKKRFINIGSVKSPEIQNNQLVLKYQRGMFCKEYFKDASAVIYFSCSDKESELIFLKEEECFYEFKWETKYACFNKIECVKRDNLDKIINLEKLKATNIQFKIQNSTYKINICKDEFTINDSQNIKLSTNIQNDNSQLFIEYKLEKNCQNQNDFNVLKIDLSCDLFLNNDHYEFDNISDCTAYLKIKHNDFCAFTTTTIPTVTNKQEDIILTTSKINTKTNYHYDTYKNQKNYQIKDCVIQIKNEEIHLNNLKPLTIKSQNKNINYTIGSNISTFCYPHFICEENKPLVTLNKCPKVTPSENELKLSFNKTEDLTYGSEIIFFCKKKNSQPEVLLETKDLVSFRYPLEALCYYQSSNNNNGSLIAGIVSCVFVICLCGVLVYYRRFLIVLCMRRDKRNTYIYCRNGEI